MDQGFCARFLGVWHGLLSQDQHARAGQQDFHDCLNQPHGNDHDRAGIADQRGEAPKQHALAHADSSR
jgi:hypothetical protein